MVAEELRVMAAGVDEFDFVVMRGSDTVVPLDGVYYLQDDDRVDVAKLEPDPPLDPPVPPLCVRYLFDGQPQELNVAPDVLFAQLRPALVRRNPLSLTLQERAHQTHICVGVTDVGDESFDDVRASYGNIARFGSCWDAVPLREVVRFVARSRCGGFVAAKSPAAAAPTAEGDAGFICRMMDRGDDAMLGVVVWQNEARVVAVVPEVTGVEVAAFAAAEFGVASFVIKTRVQRTDVAIRSAIRVAKNQRQYTFICASPPPPR